MVEVAPMSLIHSERVPLIVRLLLRAVLSVNVNLERSLRRNMCFYCFEFIGQLEKSAQRR